MCIITVAPFPGIPRWCKITTISQNLINTVLRSILFCSNDAVCAVYKYCNWNQQLILSRVWRCGYWKLARAKEWSVYFNKERLTSEDAVTTWGRGGVSSLSVSGAAAASPHKTITVRFRAGGHSPACVRVCTVLINYTCVRVRAAAAQYSRPDRARTLSASSTADLLQIIMLMSASVTSAPTQ